MSGDFSATVLKDLAKKTVEDMTTAAMRTIDMIPPNQRGVVFFQAGMIMIVQAAKILAADKAVDERTAALTLIRAAQKRIDAGELH